MQQGVSRSDIYREIEERCGKGVECDCERVAVILQDVLKALALAVAVASLVVPALRVIRIAWQMAQRIPTLKKALEDAKARETMDALEDSRDAGRVLQGEYERVDDALMALLKGDVVIKP